MATISLSRRRQLDLSLRFGAEGDDGPQVLREDGEYIFCRAWRRGADGNRSPILVVLPAAEHPPPATVNRLSHEYGLRDDLDGAWAARPLELGRRGGRTILVLEDPGGEPLERLLSAPMEVGSFLRIAIGIASALGKLHQRGLVHKDLKPANILVNCADGRVRLTGFGIASRLPRERQAPEPPGSIAGTLAYMAPEQTGRMNRSIDSRSDLYAFGITLYQMLTGRLPFTASDPMEWIHCHIARQAVAPAEWAKNAPPPVSQVIMKLLAKTPEERYQTVVGIESDLRRCLAEWERQGCIDDFQPGQYDTPDRLLIPEKLYGRAREVDTLLAAFDRIVKSGAPELVLISGYSGIGKSSVVNELHRVLVPQRALFASGKFDQYKRDIPYSTLVQAFQSLVRPLLGKSDAELARWRDAFVEALGRNGRLIVDLVPELKLIIGEQPPVPELESQHAQSRFQLVFRRFIGVFARPEHPLAIFLDDLQWLDAATLDLLEDLLTRRDLQHLMLIGAYRDNEVDSAHPLARKLDAIRKTGAAVHDIVLAPLTLGDVERFIAEALHCRQERARPLAQLVYEKTGGNPFFVIQFLAALDEERLLYFDSSAGIWIADIDRIRAKGYTDNVVDLVVTKLARLRDPTRQMLKYLACLGNGANIAALSLVEDQSAEAIHTSLWEAVHAGLILRSEDAYAFPHDRVQEAAYALIPEGERAAVHLRIGRMLLSHTPSSELEEKIFEIVNQLNRGATLVALQREKIQLAELNMIAGRKAKASTAYKSALNYFSAGIDLLGDDLWENRHDLAYQFGFERAECEYLSRNFDEALRQFDASLAHARTALEKADIHRVVIDLYTTTVALDEAIARGQEALRLFGIDIPSHPSHEKVAAEYEAIWQSLGHRPIDELIDLPLMRDPEIKAAMSILAVLFAPSIATDRNLLLLCGCLMVNMSIRYGNCDASVMAYGYLGMNLGPFFGGYRQGFQFGKLGYDLMEKRGLVAYKAKIEFIIGTYISFWLQPLNRGIEHLGSAFKAAADAGDLNVASYCCDCLVSHKLVAGEPLDKVYFESEKLLNFTRETKYDPASQIIIRTRRFIQAMQGLTVNLSSFSGFQFDEVEYERFMERYGWVSVTCGYYIMKLQACVMSGDYQAAIAARARAEPILWSIVGMIHEAEYHFYGALALAAYDDASVDEQPQILTKLEAHQKQLEIWAGTCPENFQNRDALVSAEIARIENRNLDAERLYEEAIRLASERGFIQNEGLANELAARFYAARGLQTIAGAYLRNARHCYLSWGADGKVRQLDGMYPHLRKEELAPAPTGTIGAPVEHLDLATVIKVSQAVSGEIMLDRLLDTLMRVAIEQAGAERGLLIVPRGAEPRIAANATTSGDTVVVELRDEPVAAAMLPESVLHYVLRTGESVIFDDAVAQPQFAAEPYIGQRQARSILCLPLITQAKLIGVLYLENNLAPRVFAPARIAVLKLLASQAAIALENARLYNDLAQREAKIRRLVDANIIGIVVWDFEGQILEANDAFLRMVGYDRDDLVAGRLHRTDLTPREWRERTARALAELKMTGTIQPYEKEYFRKDGSRVPVLLGAAGFDETANQGVTFVLDLTERKRAEAEARESERRYREVQMELAHANRVATMGQLTASIAHEVNQPITATVTNAQAGLRWLDGRAPDLEEVRQALTRIVKDANRAGDVIGRIRALMTRAPVRKDRLEINEAILEVVALTRVEVVKNGVAVQTKLADGLPPIQGDRVQLQQVMLNLIVNAVEAMSSVSEGARELLISTALAGSSGVLVSVRDSGPGLAPANLERLFEAFYTTKPNGLGLGLSICRSIIEAHGGRLWASANVARGAIFQFTLPAHSDIES
jgi:PAS domain S-box-containing protein